MTFAQMYDKAMVLWDKSGSPYMPQSEFDVFANNKYNDLVELFGKHIEEDERLMADIQYLYTTFTKPNSNIIDRVVDVPNFRRRMRFNSTFKDCNGVTKSPNIRISINATIDNIQDDPYQKGIDADPVCVATQLPSGNPGWQVFTDTTPLSLNMTYLRVPQTIDSANSPGTQFEGPDYIANYVIRMVVYNLDFNIENYQRSKEEKQDIAEVLS